MTKIAEQIVHDIIDELTDHLELEEFFWTDRENGDVVQQKLVGIVDENLERQLEIGIKEIVKQLGELK